MFMWVLARKGRITEGHVIFLGSKGDLSVVMSPLICSTMGKGERGNSLKLVMPTAVSSLWSSHTTRISGRQLEV